MNLPGFTAEATVYKSSTTYRSTGEANDMLQSLSHCNAVYPKFVDFETFCEKRCAHGGSSMFCCHCAGGIWNPKTHTCEFI